MVTLALEPGGAVTIRLSSEHLKSTKDFLALRKFQLADLNRAVISIDGRFCRWDEVVGWTI
jgi:hypothetical protein